MDCPDIWQIGIFQNTYNNVLVCTLWAIFQQAIELGYSKDIDVKEGIYYYYYFYWFFDTYITVIKHLRYLSYIFDLLVHLAKYRSYYLVDTL